MVHYAGAVNYSAQGFVQANTETLFEDMHILGAHSTDKLTAKLFPMDSENRPARFNATSGASGARAPSRSNAQRAKVPRFSLFIFSVTHVFPSRV